MDTIVIADVPEIVKLSLQIPDLPSMRPAIARTMTIVVVPPMIMVVPANMMILPPKIPVPVGPVMPPAGQADVRAVEEGMLVPATVINIAKVIEILDVAPIDLTPADHLEVVERSVGAQIKTIASSVVQFITFAWP